MVKLVEEYIFLFFIYSFLGWIMESLRCIPKEGRFINRGFLIGPYCPIYGVGALILTLTLKNTNNIILLFFVSFFICSLLEYIVSFIMEKLFKARWWDYSSKKFNLNGRICLDHLIFFGIGGVIIAGFMSSFLLEYIRIIPNLILHITVVILVIIYIIDIRISLEIIINLKNIKKEFKDNTEEISNIVKEIIINKFNYYIRIINAFPNIKEHIDFDNWNLNKKK